MTSRSDCEPLPKPTLSPFALARPGTFLRVGFFTAAVKSWRQSGSPKGPRIVAFRFEPF